MLQQSTDAVVSTPAAQPSKRTAPARNFAARLFGHDLFISFALGPPPRGSHSYASDLARRLRERDFTVFFSEDEVPPGEQLDNTLLKALDSSRLLVVVANRGTLQEPRWVRKEVEEFRRRHPNRPEIPISVGGALQDPTLAGQAQEWLEFQDKIWLDESADAAETGIASSALIERLATAPTRVRSNVWWRWVVRGVVTVLAALALALGLQPNWPRTAPTGRSLSFVAQYHYAWPGRRRPCSPALGRAVMRNLCSKCWSPALWRAPLQRWTVRCCPGSRQCRS